MKVIFIIALLIKVPFVSGHIQSEATTFVSGKVEFKIKNMGFTVNGTIGGVTIQFNQSAADPTTWSLEGSAAPATIATGIGLRDKHLKRSDYFDIDKYPFIRL